ncbi:MAG: FAD-dependent monooxygenase [Kofleriaceae bacterium]|nr:FAD-dependent monooxygenase [Kofleriaceae bacterium]
MPVASYDVAIVGGGPAGSTCARVLVAGGARVVVIDRAAFPRVKLCAGWLSPAIWDVLELSPRAYPRELWEWRTCHVFFRGMNHAMPGHGWFIRRYELDHFLLTRSGAELRLGTHVKEVGRDDEGFWTVALPDGTTLRARHLVGAGGTHCPVARVLSPPRPRRALGVQECELQASPGAIARTRLGHDGEPELVLFDDIGGYGWNVPKSGWLNVGCGTLDATTVRDAWQLTHAHLREAGHLPDEVEAELAHLKGHAYYLHHPAHLARATHERALLVGDSLGLAHPITGEGILPATVSGRVAAEAILADDVAGYPARLARHEVIADYTRVFRLATAAGSLKRRPTRTPSRLARYAVARGFGWMFSGAKLPAPRLLDRLLDLLPAGG